ncbi:MAG: hypothetical protein JNK24_00355 [Alphaproteobacteria bacterium]|nr:hypothetical protein [Alphaproteobacteria bacterium]
MSASKRQYPAQKGKYAIRVKGGDKWLPYDTVRMEISLGQQYHESDKLSCAVEWVKNRFQNIVVLCNDTLQRYNYAILQNNDPENFHGLTQENGIEWVTRNKKALENLKVIHWNHWLSQAEFDTTLAAVQTTYVENSIFKKAVDESLETVYSRWSRRGFISQGSRLRFLELSHRYIMEETAGLALAYKAYPGISAYPGSFLEMWRMFVGKDIKGPLQGLSNSHCIRIDFERRILQDT